MVEAKYAESSGHHRGRFAPSPTGPLHFGSLIAAVASFLNVRAVGGEWYVRIEDLDPPRTIPGATQHILATLEKLGFYWDQAPLQQSSRSAAYEQALAQLRESGCVYSCSCSRRKIASEANLGLDGAIYPGTCRDLQRPFSPQHSIRLRTDTVPIIFQDLFQGEVRQKIEAEAGDFVVQRTDQLFSYQLAVVVDDYYQGITQVIRGADLLSSTPRQIYLAQQLGYPSPQYGHLPVAIDDYRVKLSKRTHAQPIDSARPNEVLLKALRFLGQQPPGELMHAPLTILWTWAIEHWDPIKVPACREIRESDIT